MSGGLGRVVADGHDSEPGREPLPAGPVRAGVNRFDDRQSADHQVLAELAGFGHKGDGGLVVVEQLREVSMRLLATVIRLETSTTNADPYASVGKFLMTTSCNPFNVRYNSSTLVLPRTAAG
jgi:hypothetical protein